MWQWKSQGPFRYLAWQPWVQSGFLHGFIDSSIDFSSSQQSGSLQILQEQFDLKGVITIKQVHGCGFIDLTKISSQLHSTGNLIDCCEADAFVVPLALKQERLDMCCGIRTADCVPLIIRSQERVALIHAGWRGLAAGIVENIVRYLQPLDAEKRLKKSRFEVVIGPCAGVSQYEVGLDVIDALGSRAVYQKKGSGKYALDLERTVCRILTQERDCDWQIEASQQCTISNRRFFSHRRQPEIGGRNFSFVAFPSERPGVGSVS